MNNKNKIKLIASGITLCCCAAAVGAISVVSSRNEEAAPAALVQDSELPVIVLDAGHKERVLSIVILIHFICLLSEKRALI